MSTSISPAEKALKDRIKQSFLNEKRKSGHDQSLWPAPLNELTLEARKKFVYDYIFTWNEAERQPQSIPQKAYIDWIIEKWHETKLSGEPLIIEKSRRMVVSWVLRALELHDGGVKPANQLLAGQTFRDAQQHVWRIWYLYDQLRMRNEDWNLPEATPYGSLAAQMLDAFILPNGTTYTAINSDGEKVRGVGVTEIVFEEGSVYPNLEETFSQGIIITQGSAKSKGGHVVIVGNASLNPQWWNIKRRVGETQDGLHETHN